MNKFNLILQKRPDHFIWWIVHFSFFLHLNWSVNGLLLWCLYNILKHQSFGCLDFQRRDRILSCFILCFENEQESVFGMILAFGWTNRFNWSGLVAPLKYKGCYIWRWRSCNTNLLQRHFYTICKAAFSIKLNFLRSHVLITEARLPFFSVLAASTTIMPRPNRPCTSTRTAHCKCSVITLLSTQAATAKAS